MKRKASTPVKTSVSPETTPAEKPTAPAVEQLERRVRELSADLDGLTIALEAKEAEFTRLANKYLGQVVGETGKASLICQLEALSLIAAFMRMGAFDTLVLSPEEQDKRFIKLFSEGWHYCFATTAKENGKIVGRHVWQRPARAVAWDSEPHKIVAAALKNAANTEEAVQALSDARFSFCLLKQMPAASPAERMKQVGALLKKPTAKKPAQ